MSQWSKADTSYMELALQLGAGQLGRTGINPAVGCVIVRDGEVIGQGATADEGRPHAEAVALASVTGSTQGATVYVSLEPCAHCSTRGPDCTGLLIEAQIARLVCTLNDPDVRTSGAGFERLMKAGVSVEVGLLAAEGAAQIADFQKRLGGQEIG